MFDRNFALYIGAGSGYEWTFFASSIGYKSQYIA